MTAPGRQSWPRASATDRSRADLAWSRALTHPVRVEILRRLLEDEVGTPSRFAETIAVPLGVASHHTRRLRDLGLIRIARRTHRRGAVQHHYRLADRDATAHALWRYGHPSPDTAAPPVDDVPVGAAAAASWATTQRAIGELRRRREQQGISQTTLARRAGIRPDYLGRIERGEVDPRITVVLALAEGLDASLPDVFA